MNTELALPTIHMNGTSKEALVEQLCEAGSAVNTAIRALALATPNARDYYPQGPDTFKRALAQHVARMEALSGVVSELQTLVERIDGVMP